ncbi:MAG TPA: hemerythrin domain-containing protein [Polyangiaceae bacterium]|nr:hemerythrin domain-containing protein [Polyangiaceae bacterium]
MKATQLLKSQHDEVKSLFPKIESMLEKGGDATQLFEELARKLVAHDAIERELFYPACEEVDGVEDLLGESLVEHGLAEFSLYQADVSLGDEHFAHKCTVLREVLEHHIEEEEEELFPKVESKLGADVLEQLGKQMSARFEEVSKQDFRGPLLENLQQVLSGKVDLEEDEEKVKKSGSPAKAKGTQKRANSAQR